MEIRNKEVVTSYSFDNFDLIDIYEYGLAEFGEKLASAFISEIYKYIEKLETEYPLHPECRHLDSRALHGSHSPKNIKTIRKIKI